MTRVVLITGGAGGIGRATGERFAAAGDTVVYADRSAEALEGLGSDTVVADVTVVADCERFSRAVCSTPGSDLRTLSLSSMLR